jgi:hypothetical protein
MDVHIPRAITNGLRRRGVEVLTAQEDGAAELNDPPLLDRATELGCPIYTQDDDLLAEARRRQVEGIHFAGVIYSHQLRSRRFSKVCVSGDNQPFSLERRFDYATDPTRTAR